MPAEPMALRRPPIRQATLVRRDVVHTFDSFVTTIAQWWPLRPLSAGQDRVTDVVFEREPGGRVFEVWDDGTTVDMEGSFAGRFTRSRAGASGTWTLKVTMRDAAGAVTDTCDSGEVTWRVKQ